MFWVCWGGLVLALIGGVAALVARFRAGGPDERRQILWLPYGFVVLPLWLGGVSLWEAVIGEVPDADLPVLLHPARLARGRGGDRGHAARAVRDRPPLSTARSSTALLTALLAGTYAVVALLAGRLAGDSALAASAGTLAAALAFRPLRGRLQDAVDRRFARARYEGVRMLRAFLDDVRDGRAEPEDVGAALALALGDPRAEVLFRLPETGAYADRAGHLVDALPDDGRERTRARPRSRARPAAARPGDGGRTARCSTPPRSPSSSAACAWSCACSSPRSSPRARGSRRPATPSAAGSSATSTTAPSSGWSRSASSCAGCSAR